MTFIPRLTYAPSLLSRFIAATRKLDFKSYEDAVRNAISLGGDADTLGAIAGAIAEAMHSIPDEIKRRAEDHYLAEGSDMLEVIRKVYSS